jgi:hypothetical protein
VAGWPDTGWPRSGSYEATSPVSGKTVLYSEESIWEEVERIVLESQGSKFSAVQSVAEMAKLFVNPDRLVTIQAQEWAIDHNLCKSLNVPPALTLDQVSARFADAVQVIERETVSAQAFVRARSKE